MRRWGKAGFTVAELLVVVAIIAVLVAVAIPVFSGQLEKSRESADAANIRSSYAELMAAVISEDKSSSLWKADSSSWKTDPIELRQQKSGWNTASIEESLNALATVAGTITAPQAGGTAWLEYKGTQLALYYGQGSTEPTLTPTQVAEKVLGTELKMGNDLSLPGKMIVSNKPDLLNDALRAAGFNGSAYITIGLSKQEYANNILGSLYENGTDPKIVTITTDGKGLTEHALGEETSAVQYLYCKAKVNGVDTCVLCAKREVTIKITEMNGDNTVRNFNFDTSDRLTGGGTWTKVSSG